MSTAANKQALVHAYAEVATGNREPFRALYADDVSWNMMGTTSWSKTYVGKRGIAELFQRLATVLEALPVITPTRFVAEDDIVVVECNGVATTKTGKPYNNTYCIVYRFADGKIKEVTEYMDTALVEAAL